MAAMLKIRVVLSRHCIVPDAAGAPTWQSSALEQGMSTSYASLARDESNRIREHDCGPRPDPTPRRHALAIGPPPAQDLQKIAKIDAGATPGPRAGNEGFRLFSGGSGCRRRRQAGRLAQ